MFPLHRQQNTSQQPLLSSTYTLLNLLKCPIYPVFYNLFARTTGSGWHTQQSHNICHSIVPPPPLSITTQTTKTREHFFT